MFRGLLRRPRLQSALRAPVLVKGWRGFARLPFLLADIGEGIAEVEVLEWHVQVGDTVEQFDRLCEVQSDKATVEITSKYSGTILAVHTAQGDIAKVGAPLCDIDVEGEEVVADTSNETPVASAPPAAPETPPTPPPSHDTGALSVLCTPAVRRIAREEEVDLRTVRGTGRDGRILKDDILNHIAGESQSPSHASASAPSHSMIDEAVPVRGFARAMATTMTESAKIPQLTYNEDVRVCELEKLRAEVAPIAAEQYGVEKLTLLPFLIKATSVALHAAPGLNGRLSADFKTHTHVAAHNIGVAMATPQGLAVPNIKHVQQLSVLEIAAELQRLMSTALTSGRLQPADLTGGTFSLSNIGALGGTYMRPVILPPELGIGAFGRTRLLPRFSETDPTVVEAWRILPVSWSADHRIIDGATVAAFSNEFKRVAERPALLSAILR